MMKKNDTRKGLRPNSGIGDYFPAREREKRGIAQNQAQKTPQALPENKTPILSPIANSKTAPGSGFPIGTGVQHQSVKSGLPADFRS